MNVNGRTGRTIGDHQDAEQGIAPILSRDWDAPGHADSEPEILRKPAFRRNLRQSMPVPEPFRWVIQRIAVDNRTTADGSRKSVVAGVV